MEIGEEILVDWTGTYVKGKITKIKDDWVYYTVLEDVKTHVGLIKKGEQASATLNRVLDEKEKYKKGYAILSEYFDSISDEEKPNVHKELCELGL